jgi:hypothetical protein
MPMPKEKPKSFRALKVVLNAIVLNNPTPA